MQGNEDIYRSFVESFKGIAFRMTTDLKPVFFHGAVEEMTGYTESQFINNEVSYHDLIHSDDKYVIDMFKDRIGKQHGFEHEFEYRIVKKDGTIVWVNENLQNISDDLGKTIFIQGTVSNITQKKQAEEELKQSREQLVSLTKHLETAREEERKQIAIEIHDELGHALTTLKLELNILMKKRFLREDVLKKRIAEMSKFIEGTIKTLQRISTQLRPSILDHFGIVAAIEWQAKEFQKQTSIRIRLALPQADIEIEEQKSVAMFRIFQEILTNVARHAQASRVDVTLEHLGSELQLTVADNGVGIKMDKVSDPKSFGLIGMQERAKYIGGKLKINSILGIGTTITVNIPLI